MSRIAPVSLAYFGKIASRGDFVRSPQHGLLTQMLDEWLSKGLELAAADPRWKQRYDQVGACRFAFLGARSRMALVGHLIPSVDASGRRFPFVTAGAFDIDAPMPFMAHAPMALSPLWARLESIGRDACAAADATASLANAAQVLLEAETDACSFQGDFNAFLDHHTLGSLDHQLRAPHPAFELRRTLLALGLLLQPVPASQVSRLDKGIALPLPDDAAQAPLVAALWMSLIAPFLAGGDFELALFVLSRPTDGGLELNVGFAGSLPQTLQAVFDADRRREVFVDLITPDWVDSHLGEDHGTKKLAVYLMQPRLSLRQAVQTFKECFLGT